MKGYTPKVTPTVKGNIQFEPMLKNELERDK